MPSAPAALEDDAWRTATRQGLAQAAGRLRDLLTAHGLALVGGTDLFALAEHADAGRIHAALARDGIWTRAFEAHLRWLRIGLPPDDAAFARLDAALRSVMAAA